MRTVFFTALLLTMSAAAMANCTTTTDKIGEPSSECIMGAVCVHSTTGNEGHCTTDCTWLEKTELIPFFWGTHLFETGQQGFECTETTNLEEAVAGGLSVRYRCPVGFYGRPTNDTSGCTPCPNSGTTVLFDETEMSMLGGFTIESCMLQSGDVATDATGTFTVSADCPWVE